MNSMKKQMTMMKKGRLVTNDAFLYYRRCEQCIKILDEFGKSLQKEEEK